MKPLHATLVFVVLLLSSLGTGLRNYDRTRRTMQEDMSQALRKTLAEQQSLEITIDTVRNYQRHLHTAQMRNHSFVYFASDTRPHSLHSKRMRLRLADGQSREFQCYATCSRASLLTLRDQGLPLSLSLVAMLWAMGSLFYFRTRPDRWDIAMGRMTYNPVAQRFFDSHGQELRLTPMQNQLLSLFFTTDGHRLSKQQLCDTLWPRKPDASETLYTLVRRTKPIVEENGLHIVCERGRDYRIEEM